MEWQTGSKLGKEHFKAVWLSPAYPTCAEHLTQNAGLDESQAGIKIAKRNINNLRYADDTIIMAESAEDLKSLLMREWKSQLEIQRSKN